MTVSQERSKGEYLNTELRNETVFIRVNGSDIESLVASHSLGTDAGSAVVRRVFARPKSPTSSTQSVQPEFERVDLYDTFDEGRIGGYRLARQYRLDGIPISLDWTVRLPAGRRFALFDLRIRNRGGTAIRLDQDQGDTHDRIQPVSRFGLADGERTSDDGFAVQNVGQRSFTAQPLWKTYPNARWVSVNDRRTGSTLGYLHGDTAPKMVVVHERSLSYLVNEAVLRPETHIDYRIGIYIHETRPTLRDSRTAYRTIRRWVESQADGIAHSPSG